MPSIEPPLLNAPEQKLAPNSQESEEASIGAVLINPDVLPELLPILKNGNAFYYMHHRFVWQALLAIHQRGEDIDALTVVEQLKDMKDRDGQTYLDKMGGSAFITYLINNTPTHVHVETYARIVQRLYARRLLLDLASGIAKNALADDVEVDTVLADAERAVISIMDGIAPDSPESIEDALEARFNYLYGLRDGTVVNRVISTGFSELDKMFSDGGMVPGNLIFVYGRPGMGKSAFLGALIKAAIDRGRRTQFSTLEMSEWQVIDRFLSAVSKIPSEKIKRADMDEEEWAQLELAKMAMKRWPLIIDDKPGQNLTAIKAKARKNKRKGGLDMLVIDYLQIMDTGDVKTGNRTTDLGVITRELKALARALDIVVIVAVQINRESEQGADHRPKLHQARESDSIANDADTVWAVFREEYYTQKQDSVVNSSQMSPMEIICLKMREGRTGTAPALFNGTTVQVLPAVKEKRDFSDYMSRGVVRIDGNEVQF